MFTQDWVGDLEATMEAFQARVARERREKESYQQEYRSPTTLHDYLRNCHNHLYKSLRLAPERPWSTRSTDITGKFYPEVLLPWTEFETDIVPRHFGAIDKICGDVQRFPSMDHLEYEEMIIRRTSVDTESGISIIEFKSLEVPVRNIIDFAASREEFRTKYDTTRNNGDECLAFVYDYKEANKVDINYVREAVAKPHLFAEVIQRINSAQATTDGTVRDREEAEASIATSIIQVYDDMVSYGVAFGYVAAGHTLLLLYVDRNDPQTLFCHLCMPLDLADPIYGPIDLSQTAVAQMLCFCLQSLRSDARHGGSRSLAAAYVRTVMSVKKWPVPYMDASQSTDDLGLMSTEMASARRISLRYKLRSVLPRRNAKGKNDAPTRQYCTQACLLGLQRGHDLDKNCPNVALHRDGRADVSRHPLDAGQFADLMGQQLRRDPYHKCALVNYWTKAGAMGWMFKLELLPYGYTLVGKGTVTGRRSRLEQEGRIYEHLSSHQGRVVPVHLGLVDMGRGYIIPSFRFVVHMMLTSWAGEALDYNAAKTLKDKWRVPVSTMFREGVGHDGYGAASYVWNAERRCVMVSDFDHAWLLDMPKPEAFDGLVGLGGRRVSRLRC